MIVFEMPDFIKRCVHHYSVMTVLHPLYKPLANTSVLPQTHFIPHKGRCPFHSGIQTELVVCLLNGRFYDEAVPEVEEFAAINNKGDLFLSSCCRHLFLAYHNLCKEGQRKTRSEDNCWIRYWYKGSKRYQRPRRKITRDRNALKETYNLSGILLDL